MANRKLPEGEPIEDSNSGSRPALDSELLKDALHVLFHSTEMNNELHRRGTSLLGWGCVCQTDLG